MKIIELTPKEKRYLKTYGLKGSVLDTFADIQIRKFGINLSFEVGIHDLDKVVYVYNMKG